MLPSKKCQIHLRYGRLKGALTGAAVMRFFEDRGGFGADARTGSWSALGGRMAAGLAYSSAWPPICARGVEGDSVLEAG